MELKRIYERPSMIVSSDDAAESKARFTTTVFNRSPDAAQIMVDIGPASFVLYLKAHDLLALSKLFDDAANAVGG